MDCGRGLTSRDRGGDRAAWLTGIANAWAAPELIWNREDAKSPGPGARDLWALPGGQRIG